MSERVLFVDDEPQVLEGIQRALRKQVEVQTATSGAEGLRLLREAGPFALVVSDMRMPSVSGAQFLMKVREQSPDTVRLVLSGQADLQATIEAVNQGHIYRFLSKPCPVEQLLAAIEDGLKQHRLLVAEKVLLEQTLSGCVKPCHGCAEAGLSPGTLRVSDGSIGRGGPGIATATADFGGDFRRTDAGHVGVRISIGGAQAIPGYHPDDTVGASEPRSGSARHQRGRGSPKRLEIQSRRLLREYQRQAAKLARLAHHSPGILLLDTDEEGAVAVDECDGECDVRELLAQIELAMNSR